MNLLNLVPDESVRLGVGSTAEGADANPLAAELDATRKRGARLNAMLHMAEAKYRALVEHVPGIVYMAALGDYGAARYVSPQIEGLLGISPDEWIADRSLWIEHVHPDDRRRVLTEMVEIQHRRGPAELEYRMVSRDNTVRWFRDVATVLDDSEGRPCLLHGVMLELATETGALEALRRVVRRQEVLLSSAMSNTAILGLDGTILYESRSESFLGYEHDELRGRNVFELVHPTEQAIAREAFSEAIASPEKKVELVCHALHKQGDWVAIRCTSKSMAHRPEIGGVVLSCVSLSLTRRLA